MLNKYLQSALVAASALTACSHPKPIACNANLIKPDTKSIEITPNTDLKRLCKSYNTRFLGTFEHLEFTYKERLKGRNAEYLPNQVIIYTRENLHEICRHEVLHAACDVGKYKIHRPDTAIKYYNQLLKNKFAKNIKFSKHMEIIDAETSNIISNLNSIQIDNSDDFKRDFSEFVLKISPFLKNLFQTTKNAEFESFEALKQHYDKVLNSSDKIDDILNYLLVLNKALGENNFSNEIKESLLKMKKVLHLLTVRWLYIINPEEMLADTYENNELSDLEKAFLDLLEKPSEEN